MKNRRLRSNMLVLCLVVVLLTCQVLQPLDASAVDDSPVIASNLSELQAAIQNAQDGDIITIQSNITIESTTVIGDPNKRIIIHRADNTSKFIVNNGYPNLFQNIVFDGEERSSQYSMFEINQTMTFENCVFRNFVSTSDGGAVVLKTTEVIFRNCLFENNSAVSGGHIAAMNSGRATVENCTMTGGYADSKGGAIAVLSASATSNVFSSTITGNEAGEYGGGAFSQGALTFTGTKIFDNTASLGGADIVSIGWMQTLESIETFIDLFADEDIIPTAWVTDYTDGQPYSQYLRLEYNIPLPPAVILNDASLGTADNEKITGLESGKYYKVTSGEVVSYSKADGTLTTDEADASPLDGNEITGLINGETYLVEEFTPAPKTVLLDSVSLGIADNEKIVGLSAGKYYKVSVAATISYTKADGTLTSNEEEAEALTGTEIVGLTNGETYLVEEYTPPTPEPTPEPQEPIEEPGDDPDPIEEPDPSEEPIEEPTPDPEPVDDDQDEEPTPKPSPKPNSGSGGSSYSSYPVVTAPKAVVLSSGKVVIDTTKTEYLLGYSDGLLGNQNTVTRSQFAQIVYRLLTPESLEDVYSEKNTFKDVASDDWYNEAVSTLANAGLISVGTDKLFNPDKNITWGEMCSILSKFAKPNHEWKIITRHWAKDAINTAISYRWFEYNDQFNPDGEVTRLQMLKFINTMFDWTTKK